ncbi:MAG: DUF86 domain-containing protein [Acidobacteriota bacterium]
MAPIMEKIVAAKVGIIRHMLESIDTLPLEDVEIFTADARMVAAGESMLRRGIEALMDLGRHILAKGFSSPVAEYKEIGKRLGERRVLSREQATLLVQMAGYRNRLVHFYDEITPEELYDILTTRLDDIDAVLGELLAWLRTHPELLDKAL